MSATLQEFKREIMDIGLETPTGRFYGTYRGEVDSNEDPEFSGRLRLKCPAAWDTVHDYWAPSRGLPSSYGSGLWLLPSKGDKVWVTFEAGDVRFPIWEYGPFTTSRTPEAARSVDLDPTRVAVLQSVAGYRLVMDSIRNEIRLEKEGSTPQPVILGTDWVSLMRDFISDIGSLSAIPVAQGATGPLSSSPNFAAFQSLWNQRFNTVLSEVTKTI